ncbi:universal stress protein [Paucibacter sediminis]|uniref:Universal stress protein n=1 Tax=Paucibacter sediminis TaxID=3019553 RepID=A0AA95SZ33_9BURK|nr:universal stress protein [Paucibacter sp. S2-9]WIT14119.1 universal stress protein [Paucibacter sp. S2-9]
MFARILVAVGFGRSTGVAVEDGLRLAAELNAQVTFVHVVTSFDLPIVEAPAQAYLTPDELRAGLGAAAAAVLASAMAQAKAHGIDARCAAISGVSIARPLSEFAREEGCEFIVAGSSERTWWRRLFGTSVASTLADITDMPIWVSSQHPWREGGNFASRRALAPR